MPQIEKSRPGDPTTRFQTSCPLKICHTRAKCSRPRNGSPMIPACARDVLQVAEYCYSSGIASNSALADIQSPFQGMTMVAVILALYLRGWFAKISCSPKS